MGNTVVEGKGVGARCGVDEGNIAVGGGGLLAVYSFSGFQNEVRWGR